MAMGQITLFAIAGLRCRFYSNDHSPPHFHVERAGHFAAKVFFLTDPIDVRVQWGKVRASDTKKLQRVVRMHRKALLQQWERDVCL